MLGLLLGTGCRPEAKQTKQSPTPVASAVALSDDDFLRVQTIIASSCMPCHNRQTLPLVIEQTRKSNFKGLGRDTKLRVVGELEELENYMKSGLSISFTGKEELHRFFSSTAGEFYLMLDKQVMPPPWAQDLMTELKWPGYKPLSPDERLELMRYAKPYTERYLR